ncbi:MAG: rane protein [Oceanotoga sp.]|jgi:membrane protein|uniref:YihY/virulence factor BrkB family protein n=1 Tax=Oceanotoga sp. TaxID=2108366 RepID=UPI002655FDBD|nr:YihY/virulence factor BrkB family protein [Oceanotoga sp.]MDN5342694.1 rane protein [Oceanotoga sp.]
MNKTKIYELYKKIKKDQVNAISGELTYFLILSIFPFLIFFLNILNYTGIPHEILISELIITLPEQTQQLLNNIIKEISYNSSGTLLSISFILTLWTGSIGITAMIRAINKAYNIIENRSYIKIKLISLIFTIFLALLIIIVLTMLVFGQIIGNKIFVYFGVSKFFKDFWEIIRKVIPLIAMILTFAMLYKIAPAQQKNLKIKLKQTIPGAVFTTIGWIISSHIFSLYINNYANYSTMYGSLGGIIILLIWLYITSMMIIIGAEINGININPI